MKIQRFGTLRLIINVSMVLVLGSCGMVWAELDAKVEVFDPYETWLEGERWGVYIKVTNIGDESFPLLFHPDLEATQIFIIPRFDATDQDQAPPRFLPFAAAGESDWKQVDEAASRVGFLLSPGESFVYGPEAFVGTGGLPATGERRISSYRIALLIGNGKLASSPEMKHTLIRNPQAWEREVVAEVELSNLTRTASVRKIAINGATWLFRNRTRFCIIPDGATPQFSTTPDLVTIKLDGTGEEHVVISNRHGHPISGSERTVPHLHLWKSLTSRPMGAATAETKAEKSSPAERGDQREAPPPETQTSDPPSVAGGHRWLWFAVGGAVILAVALRRRFADTGAKKSG